MRVIVAFAALVVTVACTKDDTAPPVATVSFSASRPRVAVGSPVDLTYQFQVAPDAKIDGDYHVFVHVTDADGTGTPWNDDHLPPVPTSQWKPGQTISYTRTSFVPVIPSVGQVDIEVGLYKGPDRLPLRSKLSTDPAEKPPRSRSYKVGALQLVSASENLFVVRRGGWNPPEYAQDNPAQEWTWTEKAAVFGLDVNPRKDVTLYLQYDARPEVFGATPQQVTVSVGSTVVDKFTADTADISLRKIAITAAQLGTGETPEQFRLEVDRTFVPANLPSGGKDQRTLGLRVYHYFVEVK